MVELKSAVKFEFNQLNYTWYAIRNQDAQAFSKAAADVHRTSAYKWVRFP